MSAQPLTPAVFDLLSRDGKSLATIAAMFGLRETQLGLLARSWARARAHRISLGDHETVRRLFQENRSDTEIARHFGCDIETVKTCRWQLGLIRPPRHGCPLDQLRYQQDQDRVWLARIRQIERRRPTWVPSASTMDGNWT